MKYKMVIIENNFHKFFTAKQLLETHFRLNVKIISTSSHYDLIDSILAIKPNSLLSNQTLGVVSLYEEISKRNLNRRNSIVYLIINEDIPDSNGIMNYANQNKVANAA